MSGENLVLLNSSINEITLQTTVNSIVISGSLNPTTVIVPQPVTTTVEVATVGPQGPQGPQGLVTSFLITGSVTSSLDTTGTLFTLSSESSNILRVDSTGSIFLKNQLQS